MHPREASMSESFFEIAFTPGVKDEQQKHGSRAQYERIAKLRAGEHTLGQSEQHFLSLRDSFYMATVTETGWPYIQHRGGAPGFVHVLDPTTLAFADLRGNKQYVSLFFMDYPNQTRLKILGRAEIHENDEQFTSLLEQLRPTDPTDVVERAILIHVEGFDWNCPQHITPRYTEAEIARELAPLHARLKELEAENAALRKQAASTATTPSRDILSS
jgi:predicted pyridoxine 5'-phosphate oxidase superfamily flavin-nucleotide-binding protein